MKAEPASSNGDTASAPGELNLAEVLTRGAVRGQILQELAPIAMSLPWLRSQRFWSQAGLEVFTSGEVPYVVTNDGEQSRKAIEVYLASLRAAERQGSREDASYVLEIGTGSGLFAKLFLDQLKACSSADYERTTYLVADASPSLLDDTSKSGVFAEHEARVQRVLLPPLALRAAIEEALPQVVGKVRAFHANYVFDSLPFTILSASGEGLFELRLRTRIRKDLLPPGTRPPDTSDARALESWLDALLGNSASSRAALTFEAEYVRIAREDLPFADLVPPLPMDGIESGRQWVHSFGAVQCLADALSLLRSDGHVIVSDYGYEGARPEPVEFQMFGSSVAAGVNFAQLVAYGQARSNCLVGVPESDPPSLQARFFARSEAAQDVVQLFRSLYGKEPAERAEAPYREALELARSGSYEAARWKFEEAYRLQPWNWSLQEAIVSFLTYTLEDHDAGLEICKRALQLNHLSPRLWNMLGDCYYGLGVFESAEQAYRQAIRINPSEVRGRTNLAYVFLNRAMPGDALRGIGEALALDRSGECREELIGKQGEALQALAAEHLREVRANLKRLSGHHALPHRIST